MRIRDNIRKQWALPLISLFIVTILSLQAIAGIGKIYKFLFPFTDYPMYNTAHYKGESIHIRFLAYGIGEDSSEVRILPKDINMNLFQFDPAVVQMMQKHRDMEYRTRRIREYEKKHGRKLARVRIEEEIAIITDEGVERPPNKVIEVIELDSLGEMQ